MGKTRRDIDADGQESKQVAAAVSRAEADVRSVKSELDGIERAAEGYGWTITSDWRIDPGNTMIGLDRLTLAAEQQLLQGQLDTCKLHAHNADQELATAVRGSVGDIPLDAIGINRAPLHRLRVRPSPRARVSQSRGRTCCYRLVPPRPSLAVARRKARPFRPAPEAASPRRWRT